MSDHKNPLTTLEREGLQKHGLPIGTPSQLSDCFRHGVAWALAQPEQPTGWDNGLSQEYDKKLSAWFSEKPNAKEELRARTFDDYGNKII